MIRRATSKPVDNGEDLVQPVFQDKEVQMQKVVEHIQKIGFLTPEKCLAEVSWFYNTLGIEDIFFLNESVETIAEFVMSTYAAKILSFTGGKKQLQISLEHETEYGAIFLADSPPGLSVETGPQIEQKIDRNYLDKHGSDLYRVETYRSRGVSDKGEEINLRCYFVEHCKFAPDCSTDPMETDIKKIGSKNFLERASANTLQVYENLIKKAVNRTGPVIDQIEVEATGERRLIIAYRHKETHSFFSALSDLYHFYDCYSTKKYVEHFSNGMAVISIYLQQLQESKKLNMSLAIYQIMKEVSLVYLLPTSPLQPLFLQKVWSAQEAAYAYSAWKFVEHFLNRLGLEYVVLSKLLDQNNDAHAGLLSKIKTRLRTDTFHSSEILKILTKYPELVRVLFSNFASMHHVSHGSVGLTNSKRTLSTQRFESMANYSPQEILDLIKYTTANQNELKVFEAILTFNQHILKTNFFQPTKVAISYRLDPKFLNPVEYPQEVYGMFFVIGSEFRGFHVRFADVARGGIRIVRSVNADVYQRNTISLFDENYNLALTQQRKNKDIPEGGSKGTILLDVDAQDKSDVAFRKYVDGVLDLLLVGASPGIKETIVDKYGKEEILFFGPDEGTAHLMDWASNHARKRNAPFWKAFTTGKSPEFGGIPHDRYGMTTRSVHQYVLGIMNKLGLKEEECTKFQTGGPDGDLGSNEILISNDKTVAIVDGSGVLYDPAGIHRQELTRLARARKMINNFDTSLLSPQGYRVLVEEKNVNLPDGTLVESGMQFRNEFHLNQSTSATFLVPCGGRPEAVNLNNIDRMFDKDGNPRFKYIVEGANLFITQQARLSLEAKGITLYKDASANKGGVTSSSLEVFAALALNDTEFQEHMCVKGDVVPKFYADYVAEVQQIIERNAANEFECIHREHVRTGLPRSTLSDHISIKIVQLAAEIEKSPLWDNEELRELIFDEYTPNVLLDLLDLKTIAQRVPDSYLRAIFGAFLSSRYVYQYGMDASPFTFFEYMQGYLARKRQQRH
eukprot:Colp12_sorted_trinity150504_noHs@14272